MIYLDNAATTFPKPIKVYDEISNCMKNYAANPGRSSHEMALKADSKILETREIISQFFNIPNPLNVVFTKNATESLNIAIKGILNKGDHVISTKIEHNSVLRPLNTLSKKGVELTLVNVDLNGYVNIKEIENNIKKNTRLIIINHASNVLGTIQNLKKIGELAKKNGILLMVDASQSAGVVPIDVIQDNVDIMAFPGHKALFGPQGIGGLYIRDKIPVHSLNEGGTGSISDSINQPDFMPDRLESGTLNTPGIVGLGEGIKFIKKIGIDNIRNHENKLIDYLDMELSKLSYIKIYGCHLSRNRTAVLSFNVDNIDGSDVGYLLNCNGIAVRTGYHCAPLIHDIIGTKYKGTVRVSPGYFNTFNEIEKLIDVIKTTSSH
ncbi:aminotransferase class V-fold PLP-dependent enzyme [Clostridium sediminicola]|uniref:aminotransferase class V-fold PLP-dependent enzyme n=1 Tax=Clostridium sediminicola TaxID=3114879 RepID=UPI0031F20C88